MVSGSPRRTEEQLRIGALLVLAVGFTEQADASTERAPSASSAELDPAGGGPIFEAGSVFGNPDPGDQAQFDALATWYAGAPPVEQARWLTHMVARIQAELRGDTAELDENIHPSHLVRVLKSEPRYMQELILRHLPAGCADPLAEELALSLHPDRSAVDDPALTRHTVGSEREPPRENEIAHSIGRALEGPVIAVVRRAFLSQFVSRDSLSMTTPFDLLSREDLGQLIRLIGIREAAIACRGVESVEAVGFFLSRFAAEEACAIATHAAALLNVSPQRVGFADRVVRQVALESLGGASMLEQIGTRLLPVALRTRDASKLRYTLQKLPYETARLVHADTLAADFGLDDETETQVARDIEQMAMHLQSGGALQRQESCKQQAASAARSCV